MTDHDDDGDDGDDADLLSERVEGVVAADEELRLAVRVLGARVHVLAQRVAGAAALRHPQALALQVGVLAPVLVRVQPAALQLQGGGGREITSSY